MPSAASKRAVVIVHGFGTGGCRTCGFNGHLGALAAGLQQRGFNVLIFDLRGHGQSSEAHYTFGLREKRDVEGAVDWLLAQGFSPGTIGVLGESMGGAASIFAATEEPAIGALVTDSTFSDLNQVLRVEFPKRSGLPAFFVPGAYIMGRLITGEDLSTAQPVADQSGEPFYRRRVREALDAGEIVPLTTSLERDCRTTTRGIVYDQWASFVEFLLTTYGRERFDALYRDSSGRAAGSANHTGVYNKTLTQLEAEWLSQLQTQNAK